MRLAKEPLAYLTIQAVATFVLYAKYLAVLGRNSDSASYENFSFDSLRVVFSNIRTVGYPLFLAAAKLISPDLSILPYLQFGLYVLAVFLFYSSLRIFGFPKWLAFSAGAPLLFERILLQFGPCVMTESLGAALSIAATSLFFLVLAKPRSVTLWIVFAAVVFLTYQVRPAYVFLVLLFPVLQLVIGLIRKTDGRDLVKAVSVVAVILILPLTAFCSFRYVTVGHFGLAPLFGRNLACTTTQFLTEECADGLDSNLKQFALETIRIRDERFGADRSRTMVPMPVSFNYWLANGEVLGEAFKRVFPDALTHDPIVYDRTCFTLAVATIRTHPLQHAIYLCKLFFYGVSFTLYVEVGIPIFLLLLFACFLSARLLSRPSVHAQADRDASASFYFAVLIILSVLFYLAKLMVVISAQFTEGRYLMAAAVFLPSMLSGAVAFLASKEFNWSLS